MSVRTHRRCRPVHGGCDPRRIGAGRGAAADNSWPNRWPKPSPCAAELTRLFTTPVGHCAPLHPGRKAGRSSARWRIDAYRTVLGRGGASARILL
ncbi:MAG: hypothetical protein R2856_28235 [Caldilineaceae bacterium]